MFSEFFVDLRFAAVELNLGRGTSTAGTKDKAAGTAAAGFGGISRAT
jgi:hypothetical protein